MTEGPYKLPEGWRWVRLGEVCTLIEVGFAFRKKGAPEGDLLHLRPYNIGEDGTLVLSQRFYLPSSLGLARHKMLQPGDVLFNNTNSVELVGKTALVREPLEAAFSNHITLLRSDTTKAEGAWIALALQTLWRQGFFANLCNKWIGQAGINTETLKSVLIPLPPLAEQRRIVARIEELMDRVREARRLRQEAQKDAERLWQSVLAQTFPRPGSDLPEGWRWVRLGEVAWRDSITLQPNSQPDTVFHYLGMEHVAPGQWDEPTPVELPGAEIKSQVIVYRPGLVLYGKLRPYLNKVVVPSAEGVASTEFIPLAVKEDVLEPQYLGAYLRSPSFVSYATQNTTGSRQPRVRLDALWDAPIPLPPLAEQRRIVAHLEAVQERLKALKEAQAATEAELKRLEQAILEKAFRGEL